LFSNGHGVDHRKQCFQQFLCLCVWICYHENLFVWDRYLVSDLHTTIFNCVCILLHAPLFVMGWIAYFYLTIHTITICLLTLHFDETCFAHNVIIIMFVYGIM
jgi:hypothetical protein